MRGRQIPIRQMLAATAASAVFTILAAGQAMADVVGRLKFSVKNAADEKPLANAKIVLKDSANQRGDVTLITDAQGSVTSPQLENRAWHVTTNAEKPDTFQQDVRDVTVVSDTTSDVEVLLEPAKEKTIVIKGQKDVIQKGNPASSVRRDSSFINRVPLATNPQSLTQVLKAVPGLVQDSVNQAHPRGEHSSTSIYIDGFALPGALQGRGGPTISPDVIQTLDVLTGGYAPEYGGELAAVLNVNLKAGSIKPFQSLLLQGGEFDTLYGNLAFGGQLGAPIGPKDAQGNQAHRIGYYLNFSGRTTSNGLEPPQPDNQTAHNRGESQTYFGNFTLNAGSRDNLSFTVNAAPAYTQIADRTGLPDSFAPFGQGFGYAGHLSRVDAEAMGIPSQFAAGQDIYQRDQNEFGALNWRHSFDSKLSGLLSVGISHAGLDILNHNPGVDLNNLQADNSIEFNPSIRRHAHNFQVQGSLTGTHGKHTIKSGLLTDEQELNESYNLVPTSQLAVNALAAVDARLLPSGTPQVDAMGMPVMDGLGNQVFLLDPNGASPTLNVKHTGFYRAAYIQDTWNATKKFTMNYGLRLDWYHADVTLLGMTNTIDTVHLSPRINMAYLLTPKTILRASYNRLFTQPPLSQAATLGQATPPQTGYLYEGSIERQVASNQTLKVAAYYKEWHNFADTGLLVPGTQLGVFTTFSHPHVNVLGIETSYDLIPKNNTGLGAYVTWANAVNRLLPPEDGYTDHDQLNTVGFGISYTWKSQANIGCSLYHGSGVASSVVDVDRTPRTVLNLRLASSPNLFGGTTNNGRGGVALDIENLLDDRPVINFQSAFSGTRFQQGRRIIFSVNGKF